MGNAIYTKAEREQRGEEIHGFAVHLAAAAFPLINGGEYQALVEDIRANGLHEPIWATAAPFEDPEEAEWDRQWDQHACHEHERTGCDSCRESLDESEVGEVLDGRNRLRACIDAKVTPRFRRYESNDPVGFVVSMNIHRRHLDESQRGMIAARLAKLPKGVRADTSIGVSGKTQAQAADLLNVGQATVQRGRAVLDRGVPELVQAVDRGELAISRAAEISRLSEEDQRTYLDPAYGGRAPAGSVSGGDSYDSDEWYTPIAVVEAAREVLGAIDLDPATCKFAQSRIRADRFFTKEDNGLDKPWSGRVWLNPPYSQPAANQFAEKLIEEWRAGRVTSAVVVQNASTDTGWFHSLAKEGAICLTRGRISFDREDGRGSQNRYGQVFFYLGKSQKRFEEVFSRFGLVGRLRGSE